MFEMATGRLPFAGVSPAETVSNVLDKDPVPITTLSAGRSVRLERVITRLLAKLPEDRFQTARELQDALAAPPSKGFLGKILRT